MCVQESDTDRPAPLRQSDAARVLAETTSNDRLYIEIDIVGVSERALELIATKVRKDPSVFDVHWHPIC
jgi:hypothetical protein